MCGERRQSEQVGVLLSEKTTAASLESLYNLLGGMVGISLNKEVYVIRQDSQSDDLPILFDGNFADDLTKASGNSPLEYLGPSGRAPYEMVLDRVDGVPTVPVCFFVYRHTLSSHAKVIGYSRSSRFALGEASVISHRSSVIGFLLMTDDY